MNKLTHVACPLAASPQTLIVLRIMDGVTALAFAVRTFPPNTNNNKNEKESAKPISPPVTPSKYKPLSPITDTFRQFRGISSETIKKYKVDVAGNPERQVSS